MAKRPRGAVSIAGMAIAVLCQCNVTVAHEAVRSRDASSTAPFMLPSAHTVVSVIDALEADEWRDAGLDTAHAACVLLRHNGSDVESASGAGAAQNGPAGADDANVYAQRVAASRELLRTLTGNCTSVMEGVFTYELCAGVSVMQSSGDSGNFRLGRFDEAATRAEAFNVQAYTGGDMCGPAARRTSVVWKCGVAFEALRVREPSTCVYEVEASHPWLCGWETPEGQDLPLAELRKRSLPFPATGPVSAGSALRARLHGRVSAGDVALLGALPAGVADTVVRVLNSRPAATDEPPTQAGTDGLSPVDVPGTGGGSIGLDDRKRGGKQWVAMDATDSAARESTWVLDAYHAWVSHAGASEVSHTVRLTCSVYSTDDLRKSSAVLPVATDPEAAGREDRHSLGVFTLLVLVDSARLDVASPVLVRSVVRGVNRAHVDTRVHTSSEELRRPTHAVAVVGSDMCARLVEAAKLRVPEDTGVASWTCVGALGDVRVPSRNAVFESAAITLDVPLRS